MRVHACAWMHAFWQRVRWPGRGSGCVRRVVVVVAAMADGVRCGLDLDGKIHAIVGNDGGKIVANLTLAAFRLVAERRERLADLQMRRDESAVTRERG